MSNESSWALALVSVAAFGCGNSPTAPANPPPPTDTVVSFASVSSGNFHTCGLAATGTYCWGTSGSVPELVHGDIAFYAVKAGGKETCALTSTGAPYCWTSDLVPLAVPGSHQFSALTMNGGLGPNHACGLATNSAAYCWGNNYYGQLGDGTTTGTEFNKGWPMRPSPVAVSGGLQFSAISAGEFHTCGLTTTGMAYCWGLNEYGILGSGDSTNSSVPAPVTGGLTFSSLTSGGYHNCALTAGGKAYCWGQNSVGELGNGAYTISSASPIAVVGDLTFSALSAGRDFTCGVTVTGETYCWGLNIFGQLGTGDAVGPEECPVYPHRGCSTRPVLVSGNLRFAAISGGGNHTCGITESGVVYCWGLNDQGQLGNGLAPSDMCAIVTGPFYVGGQYCAAPQKVARQR